MKIIRQWQRLYYLITFIIVFFLCFIMYKAYTINTSKKINELTHSYFKQDIYNNINNSLENCLSNIGDKELLIIEKNKKDEIVTIDFDLKDSYQFLNDFTNEIKNNKIDSIKEVNFFVGTNNIFLYNAGPKIKVKLDYLTSVITKLSTNIKSYGINNALIEIYVDVDIKGRIISQINVEEISYSYKLLLESKVVNGKVPNIIGTNSISLEE